MAFVSKTSGTISADGNTTSVLLTSTYDRDAEGFYIHLSGSFGSGTVKVQFQAEGGSWVDVANGSFTAAVDKIILLPNQTNIRLNTSGSTTPSIFYQLSGAGTSGFDV